MTKENQDNIRRCLVCSSKTMAKTAKSLSYSTEDLLSTLGILVALLDSQTVQNAWSLSRDILQEAGLLSVRTVSDLLKLDYDRMTRTLAYLQLFTDLIDHVFDEQHIYDMDDGHG